MLTFLDFYDIIHSLAVIGLLGLIAAFSFLKRRNAVSKWTITIKLVKKNYGATLRNNVSVGTATLETPSRNFTIGTNANRIIKSLVATCTTV